MDRYSSMSELLSKLSPKNNYSIHADRSRQSKVKIFAPHGGCIEPCTEPIALAIAMEKHDCFVFSGRRKRGCFNMLHVTSTHYDEPHCLQMAEEAELAIAVHGSDDADDVIHVGGGNTRLGQELTAYLKSLGFPAKPAPPGLEGGDERNFVNRARQKGIQLELSSGFRKSLFPGFPGGIQRDSVRFPRFIGSMRAWIAILEGQFGRRSIDPQAIGS
jgi:phage replication-related protein YjqB (UPF0714/DUF867 family)